MVIAPTAHVLGASERDHDRSKKKGFLSQLGPIIPSFFFLSPLPKTPRKAVKSDRQWNQNSVLLPGYPPLDLWGT